MPRRQQFESQIIATPRATVASATRLTMRKGEEGKAPRDDNSWQRTAWERYDTIGEYRYACAWVGNLLSRALLTVVKDGKPSTDSDAKAAMDSLFGGQEGQREMLRQLGTHFTVAGEGYIIGEDGGDDPGDRWWVVASSEVTKTGGEWKVGKKPVNNPLVIRLWRPHPRVNTKPDSPSRAVLPILAEINGLSEHIAATIDSRLAGAGMLLLPDGISFATTTNTEGTAEDQKTSLNGDLDSFLDELMQTMMTAIRNRADSSALVPILLQAPGEHLEHIRHLTFSTPFDEQSVELRKEAIRRLALGMDMPPEILTGTGEINHWGAWQVEEASIKAHTEPLLHVITDSLTEGYLRPYLEGLDGWDEEKAREFSITADTTKMRLRPNRSKEAIELFDRAALSKEAMVRENGFDESDIMPDDEVTQFFTEKVAGGSTTPELVAQALQILGVPVFTPPAEPIEVQEGRPTRSLLEHPENNPPDPGIISDEAAAVAEVVVFRALERAGNRIKSKYKEHISLGAENVPAHTLYRFTRQLNEEQIKDVMIDAWSCLASLPPIPVDAQTLDEYTRGLLRSNRPHDSRTFRAFLAEKNSF
jgi:hypothetical protein